MNIISTIQTHYFPSPMKMETYDPIATGLRLAIYQFYPNGTKLTIQQHHIRFVEPTMFQSVLRWMQSSGKHELGFLGEPLLGLIWMKEEKLIGEDNYNLLAEMIIQSLKILRAVYLDYQVITYLLDYYTKLITDGVVPKSYVPNPIYREYAKHWHEHNIFQLCMNFLSIMREGDTRHVVQFQDIINTIEIGALRIK